MKRGSVQVNYVFTMSITYQEYLAYFTETTEGGIPLEEAAFNALSDAQKADLNPNAATNVDGNHVFDTLTDFAGKVLAGEIAQVPFDGARLARSSGELGVQVIRAVAPAVAETAGNWIRNNTDKLPGSRFFRGRGKGKGAGTGAPRSAGVSKPPESPPPGSTTLGKPDTNSGKRYIVDTTYKPTPVIIDTPIIANCYGDTWNAINGNYKPLYLNGHKLTFSLTKAPSDMITAWDIISSLYNAYAQKTVRFKIASDLLTSAKLVNYFDTIATALQVYYFYGSVIEYNKNCVNNTRAMLFLQEGITNDSIDKMHQLAKLICAYPIPPNLAQVCNYLMSTFRMSEVAGSAIYKFIPFSMGSVGTQSYFRVFTSRSNPIEDSISQLMDSQCVETASLLSKIFPEWTNYGLTTPAATALYDPNFKTLWANSSTMRGSKIIPDSNTVALDQPYYSFTNRIDGLITSLWSGYYNSTNYNTGLFRPIPTLMGGWSVATVSSETNRFVYDIQNGNEGFYNACISVNHDHAYTYRFESNVTPDTTWASYNLTGAVPVKGINGRSCSNSAVKAVLWMMGADLIC